MILCDRADVSAAIICIRMGTVTYREPEYSDMLQNIFVDKRDEDVTLRLQLDVEAQTGWPFDTQK